MTVAAGATTAIFHGHGRNGNFEPDGNGDGNAEWGFGHGFADGVANSDGDRRAVHTHDGEFGQHVELHGDAVAGGADGRVERHAEEQQHYGADGSGFGDRGGCGDDSDVYGDGGDRNGQPGGNNYGVVEWKFGHGLGDGVATGDERDGYEFAVRADHNHFGW